MIRFAVNDGLMAALREVARRNRSPGAGKYLPRLIGKKTGKPAKGWYPERGTSYDEAEAILAKKMHPARLAPLQFSRGDYLKRALPNFPGPLGDRGFVKGGQIQKEATKALKKLRRGSSGNMGFLNMLSDLSKAIEFGTMTFADPRPRNQQGEFTGNTDQVADPNTMVKTYGPPGGQPPVEDVEEEDAGPAQKALLAKANKARGK